VSHTPYHCEVESCQIVWILSHDDGFLSCEDAVQLACGKSVVLLHRVRKPNLCLK
jgi:hypothetical protein